MITQKYLKENFNYNHLTGELSWIKDSKKGGFKAGRICNCLDVHGYVQINLNGKVYKGHRLIWLYIYGKMPNGQIDHINHNRADNRIENLRCVNNYENHLNRPKQSNNKTGCVGVNFYSRINKYRAYITVNKKQIHLGFFEKIEDAIIARQNANQKYNYHENHGLGFGVKKYKKYN